MNVNKGGGSAGPSGPQCGNLTWSWIRAENHGLMQLLVSAWRRISTCRSLLKSLGFCDGVHCAFCCGVDRPNIVMAKLLNLDIKRRRFVFDRVNKAGRLVVLILAWDQTLGGRSRLLALNVDLLLFFNCEILYHLGRINSCL